jgi:putative addiction module killer protein
MYTFLRSNEFDKWLSDLRDHVAKARILVRIRSAELGNLSDCKPVGDGISEMRINVGPGYRVYFARRGKVVYLLLCGGDKSTQKRDIQRAKTMLEKFEKE